MRRLIQRLTAWWNRPVAVAVVPVSTTPAPPPAPTNYAVVEVEGSRVAGLPPITALPRPSAPPDRRVHEEASAIGTAYWPEWTPPTPAMPANVHAFVRRTARELRTDLSSVVFTADDLPLPDDPYTMDVDWILAVYNLLTARRDALTTAQRVALHRIVQTPRRARLTLTIYLPYFVGEMAKRTVIQSLRNEVQSVLGPHILWGDMDARCFPSNDPAWAVSIASVDAPLEGGA